MTQPRACARGLLENRAREETVRFRARNRSLMVAARHVVTLLGHLPMLGAGRAAVAAILAVLLTPGCFIPIGSERTTVARVGDVSVAPPPDPRGGLAGTVRLDQLSVNNETISAADVWRGHLEELTGQVKSLSFEGFRAYANQRGNQLVNDKITESVLYQKATLGASPAFLRQVADIIDQETRRIVTTEHGGRQLRYAKALKAQGQTIAGAMEQRRRQIITMKFVQQSVEPKMSEPTRAELLDSFEREAPSLHKPASRHMSLIDVRIDARPIGDAQTENPRAQALARIRAAQADLKRGEPFTTVAKQYSDGNHAIDGGRWGWVQKGSVTERFEPAVATLYQLPAKGTSDVIEHAAGFFLVRCDEIDPGFVPNFESAQPTLLFDLRQAAFNREAIKLVTELRADARLAPADPADFLRAVVRHALDLRSEILATGP